MFLLGTICLEPQATQLIYSTHFFQSMKIHIACPLLRGFVDSTGSAKAGQAQTAACPTACGAPAATGSACPAQAPTLVEPKAGPWVGRLVG